MNNSINSILLIDDDEISLSINQLTLEEMAMTKEVHVFQDASEAFEYLKLKSFETIDKIILLIIDLNMPGMSGEDLVINLSTLPFYKSKLRIVIYSAILPSGKYQYLRSLGVDEFLEKPLTPNSLSAVIERMGITSF